MHLLINPFNFVILLNFLKHEINDDYLFIEYNLKTRIKLNKIRTLEFKKYSGWLVGQGKRIGRVGRGFDS